MRRGPAPDAELLRLGQRTFEDLLHRDAFRGRQWTTEHADYSRT